MLKVKHYYFYSYYNQQLYLNYITNGYICQEIFEKFFKNFKRNTMEFSERLKKLRKQAQLTQVDVAEKLGISQPAYASWERGVKKPTQENLVKIAKLFNASVDTLVSNDKTHEIDLSEVELLFRTTSEGMNNEEKEVFKQELLQFMKERKKLFEGGNNE